MLYIFDIGGVCTNNASDNFTKLCNVLNITKEQFDQYSTNPTNIALEHANGDIDNKGFWTEFSKRSRIKVNCDWYHMFFHPQRNEKTYDIIKQLKALGHRVVAGTNTIDSHYQNHIERGDYEIFDQTYASIFMGVSKPEIDFWNIIMKAEGVQSKDCVFIDDKIENVNAAKSLGINAIHFTDCDSLKKELGL